MSRGLRWLSLGLGVWSLAAVVRALGLAQALADGNGRTPGSLFAEAAVWAGPALIAGLVAVTSVSRPSSDIDEFLARNVRMGVMVALFAVALSWVLVLYAGYLQTLGQG